MILLRIKQNISLEKLLSDLITIPIASIAFIFCGEGNKINTDDPKGAEQNDSKLNEDAREPGLEWKLV